MTISWPDPDIGRCESVRVKTYGDGFVEQVRCLDYEGHDSRCDFPPFAHVTTPPGAGGTTYSFNMPKPKRWIKPSDRGQQEAGQRGGGSDNDG